MAGTRARQGTSVLPCAWLVAALAVTGCGDAGSPGTRPLLATGQTAAQMADKNDGRARPAAVADDGRLQLGLPLRYVDNGNGTVTDLNTGLTWEK